MGILKSSLYGICYAGENGVNFKQTATIGRQYVITAFQSDYVNVRNNSTPPPQPHVNYYKTTVCEPRRIHEWGECRNKESVQYQHKKVGILYIGLARYIVFWKDFYLSSEKYFLPGIEKQYFVFTDEEDKIEKKDNVTVYHQESFGEWAKNTMYRFKIFLEHQEDYSDCDYLYFFNANTLFRKKVTPKEFIPEEKDNYLMALSFDYNRDKPKDSWPYERRTESCAYIPYGEGHYYYQGGLFGGRRQEYLELVTTCNEWVRKDEANNVIACLQDESHLNKYLLNKKIKIVGSKYGKGEDVDLVFYLYCKIILRDKYKVLGDYYMEIKKGYKPEKFSLKRYSLRRFLRKSVNKILFKYRDASI